MRIGIDARMLGPNVGGGGLGRYVEELVRELTQLDHKNRYVLFRKSEVGDRRSEKAKTNFRTSVTDVHWYTLKEQILMPWLIDREHLDLIHFPHWNVPLFLRTPFVLTIHDLILLDEPGSAKATTRHPLVYLAKRLAHRIVLRRALKRARAIIAVSQYTKSAILRHFPWVPSKKIHVIHEGLTRLGGDSKIDEMRSAGGEQTPRRSSATTRLLRAEARADRDFQSTSPYFLYIGNAYPHKNLESLLHAFSFFHKLHPDIRLVLAGRDDVFYQRLKKELVEIDVTPDAVRFVMNPTDASLAELYRGATLYLFPSRSEGFGLPPLEAMSFGVPVAAARRTSLPEILGEAALWFDPNNIEEMVEAMETALTDKDLRAQLIQKGFEQIKRYSWTSMARDMVQVYQDSQGLQPRRDAPKGA